jgi:hypothetical protein
MSHLKNKKKKKGKKIILSFSISEVVARNIAKVRKQLFSETSGLKPTSD